MAGKAAPGSFSGSSRSFCGIRGNPKAWRAGKIDTHIRPRYNVGSSTVGAGDAEKPI